ncbi:hypothetical protein TraAM80_10457 [Trypanosoma rangeli]|uniref:Mucin-associated surface protein (MASP) n=1 Tax=Trypanosoma rangeli TaxID=5698 RepID=A0A422MP95_TRYRA|nr:uncharacterized protein TraAM80_10457 [Trypanosoma rangeli]RNE94993.1 hypothetical protein TraAM80_10457 [Trypanosoma rangeli]|eukprot:RNE94993.1 hypothetical protein TraAM80_10457 [Trypanosoma rangeli]
MTEAEVEGKHCSHKPEPLRGMRASVQSADGDGEGVTTNGDQSEIDDVQGSDPGTAGGGEPTQQSDDENGSGSERALEEPNSTGLEQNSEETSPPRPPAPEAPKKEKENRTGEVKNTECALEEEGPEVSGKREMQGCGTSRKSEDGLQSSSSEENLSLTNPGKEDSSPKPASEGETGNNNVGKGANAEQQSQQQQRQLEESGAQEDTKARETSEEKAAALPTSQQNHPSQPQTRAQETQNGVDATKQLSSSDAAGPPGVTTSQISAGSHAQATPSPTSETGDGTAGTQAEDSTEKNSKGKTESDSSVAPHGQQDVATAGAKTSGDKEPAAAAEGAVTNKNNSAITADSDSSAAASHCISPLALLLLACASAAAMVIA